MKHAARHAIRRLGRSRPGRWAFGSVLVAGAMLATMAVAPSSAMAALEPCRYYTYIKNTATYESWIPVGDTTLDCGLVWGSKGPGVYALQVAINDCYLAPAGKTLLILDADFGRRTYEALRFAQGKAGTSVDGQYGPKTRKAFLWPGGTGGFETCYPLP